MVSIEKEYNIHYYDINFKKELLITSVMNFFQDIFVYVSEVNGKGMDYLANIDLTWVVYKWKINMYQYPAYNQRIIIKMTPTAYKKSYMNIKFEVFNVCREKIADAFSLWILINTKKNLPCRTAVEDVYRIFGLDENDNNITMMKKVDLPRNIENEEAFKVRYSDIDTNGHVNNVKYLSWLLDSMPEEIIKQYKLREIEINYKKNTKYNEIITSSCEIIKERALIKCLHKVISKEDGLLVIAETHWGK